MHKQKGVVEIVLVVLLVAALGLAGWFYLQSGKTPLKPPAKWFVDDEETLEDRSAASLTPTSIPFETIDRGYYSGFRFFDPKYQVVNNAGDWITVWKKAKGAETSTPDLPQIDFAKNVVVVISQGNFAAGGQGVEITGVKESKDEVTVHIKETFLGDNCIVTQSVQSPYLIIKLPVTSKKIDFVSKSETIDC